MEKILEIKNISKHFEGICAVDDACFSLKKGTITGIYGDNGAGKTTLFNLISGFELPDNGNIFFNDANITHKSVLKRAQMGMGRLFQNPRIFSEVSVFDNLLGASRHSTGHNLLNYFHKRKIIREENFANTSKATEILKQFSLNTKSSQKAYELSVGERKLLSLGCLLMNNSSFILLDELTSGLNNNMITRMNDIIMQLNKSGVTFLMIEHDHEIIENLCTKIYEMQNGKLIEK